MKRHWFPVLSLACFGAALLVPLVVPDTYTLQVMFRIFVFAALGLAWNLVGGYAGQLSLGHAAFFGVGAYGLALFAKAGFHPWIAVFFAMACSLVAAAAIGKVCFRLRGPYFTLATIAFAEVLRLVAKNLPNVTGGDVGVQVPMLFSGAASTQWFYESAVVLTGASLLLTLWISRRRFGYYLMAIREDEDTALSVGVNAARNKLYSLLISAGITALGGALYASLFLFIVPDQVLSIDISNEIAIVAMLGGAGTVLGPVVGAVVLESCAEVFKSVFKEAHLLIYGALLVVVVLFLPEGIVGTLGRRLRLFRRALPVPFAAASPEPVRSEPDRAAVKDLGAQ